MKAYELRTQSEAELLKKLDELKLELASLRVAKVTGGAASKLAKIGEVRKSIARVLTVYNQKTKSALRAKYAGAKHTPLNLREEKTRAIRRRLSKEQASKLTVKAAKKAANFPQRYFAVKA